MSTIIRLENVYKQYPAKRKARILLGKGGLLRFFGAGPADTFDALHDISFTVEAGESVGLIGPNGSGKSTLMKVLAGVTEPTRGHVEVHGRVASLLELGAGFHPYLTGRENIYLNAGILGMRHADVDKVFDSIVAFSGIGDFIDNPVDTYSSGMYVRIAFSIAVHVNPDIFLVDEVLAVGDEEFQRKCRVRIGELREQGKTIVFVSHDLGIVNTLCDRVVLLNKGSMIVRDTPQKTIDFYLRQVGQERGVHTMSAGTTDAVLSNGRISLFSEQDEVSAPTGLTARFSSMGSWHEAASAMWRIENDGPDRCVAIGQLPRLAASLRYEVLLQEKRLMWSVSIDCERAITLDDAHINVFLPLAFDQWLYGDLSGVFPDISPADIAWTTIVAPEKSSREAVALPASDATLPPIFVRMEHAHPLFRMTWANTDYVLGSRALQVVARFPQQASAFEVGRHDLLSLNIDLGLNVDDARKRVQLERTLHSGALSLRFEQGMLRLSDGDRELSVAHHFYASMLIQHLWHDSRSLQWGAVGLTDTSLTVSGESRRFPISQHWRVDVVDGGFDITIELDATEPIAMQEYHASLLLEPAYGQWETEGESGAFPAIGESTTWRHLNQDYTPGSRITATGDGLPRVSVEVNAEGPAFSMTPLNTGSHENARVLQALCTSESGQVYFEPGRSIYFRGRIRVGG